MRPMNISNGASPQPDRNFGLLLSVVLLVLARYGYSEAWPLPTLVTIIFLSLIFGGIALISPSVLRPLNEAWLKLGLILGCVTNPVILGVIFFGLMTPVALFGRLFGRDELCLRRKERDTYWIIRSPDQFDLDSFKRQF